MTHPLEPLLALQKKDLKLIRILREIHDIPKRRDNIESQLSGTKKKLETAVESRKHTESSLHDNENAKTNEQYRAFVQQIGTVEEEIKFLEDKQISLMEDLEQGKTIEKDCKDQLKTEESAIADELNELDDRFNELTERSNQMKLDRRRMAENCDGNLLKKYSRILNNKKDAAIVFIESGAHCGGCHMKLPPQVINDAKNASKIVGCNFCGRILYNPIT